ncbi:MAG: SpoVR family protein [Parcubacteria group bacterium]|nr:SpoVR family protein [Parcubacteria group bacterium]
MSKKFPTELKEQKYRIERKARRAGLDFFKVIFELVDFDTMNEVAAYNGFPNHWNYFLYAQEYEMLRKQRRYGLQTIYELVINTDPAYAYLLMNNKLVEQKTVMIHVNGHVDFFKNNVWFSETNRKMFSEMSVYSHSIAQIKEEVGEEKVEDFIMHCDSIKNLIDHYASLIVRERREEINLLDDKKIPTKQIEKIQIPRGKGYLDKYINPPEWIKEQEEQLKKDIEEKREIELGRMTPPEPTRDILSFLMRYAPLENWQRRILEIVRDEQLYFAPQAMTKIMNEGWASFWHNKIALEMGGITDAEVVQFADHNAGVLFMSPQHLNPYKIGFTIFKDIEYRWNTGRHGALWTECAFQKVIDRWDDFVAFNNMYHVARGNPTVYEKEWHEYCFFKKAIQNGLFGFPEDYYLPERTLELWNAYLHNAIFSKKFDEELKQLHTEGLLYTQKIEKNSNNTARSKRVELQLSLINEDIHDVNIQRKLLRILRTIKEKFSLVALSKHKELLRELKKFPYLHKEYQFNRFKDFIPQEFIEYAIHCNAEIPIGIGKEKIFEIRRDYNDVIFIHEFFTKHILESIYGELLSENDFMVFKKRFVFNLTNSGQPVITLDDANFAESGHLYLAYHSEGVNLDQRYIEDTMRVLYDLWQKDIYLEAPFYDFSDAREYEEYKKLGYSDEDLKGSGIEKPTELLGDLLLYYFDGKKITNETIEKDIAIPHPFYT